MNRKLQKLVQKREHLVLQAEKQREQLVQIVEVWRAPLAIADKGLAVISFIKKHPAWLVGGSAIFLKLVRPNRIGKWLGRGWVAWQLMRKLQSKFLV
jgi:hypothetical protein